MASPSHPSRKKSRRLLFMMTAIAVIIVLYTAGWLYLAYEGKTRARIQLANAIQSGLNIECRSLSAQGYPFSLFINCDDIKWRDTQQGISLNSSGFSVGASLFSPLNLQNRMTSPAMIALDGASPIKADWDTLSSSAKLNSGNTQNIRINAENLRLQQVMGQTGTSLIEQPAVTLAGLHFNLNGIADPLQIKLTFDDLRVTGLAPFSALPEIDGMLDLSSAASLNVMKNKNPGESILRGKSVTINQALLLLPSGASLSVSGPFTVDQSGMANADLKIRITNAAAIGKVLQTVFPDQAKNITTVIFALGSMPKDETGAAIVPLIIRNSKVSASFIPLGRIPPL